MHIFGKMKRDYLKTVEIPEGIEVSVADSKVSVKGKDAELVREFQLGKIKIEKTEKAIEISCKKATKREVKMINTMAAHIKNMMKGVVEKFEYKLKVCSSHFPVTVKVEGDKAVISNFLGEKIDRTSKILEGCDVKVEKEIITVNCLDIEKAGQTAANFEKATIVKGRDRRVFQDGIFITHKPRGAIA